MTIIDRLRTWLGDIHWRHTDRYLAKHPRHSGAQSTKGKS